MFNLTNQEKLPPKMSIPDDISVKNQLFMKKLIVLIPLLPFVDFNNPDPQLPRIFFPIHSLSPSEPPFSRHPLDSRRVLKSCLKNAQPSPKGVNIKNGEENFILDFPRVCYCSDSSPLAFLSIRINLWWICTYIY